MRQSLFFLKNFSFGEGFSICNTELRVLSTNFVSKSMKHCV